MASKISINLDTSKENFLVTKCKQNDDLTLEAYIYENGAELSLTNKEIIIQALKSDNTYIIQNTEIIKENNKILAELDRDFSRVSGTTKIEIVLTESGKQNTTFSFYLEVSASVIKGAVESSNTVTILENLQNKIVEAGAVKEETEQLISSGGAATTGDIANINAQLEQKAQKNDIALQSLKNKNLIDSIASISSSVSKSINTDSTVVTENFNDLSKWKSPTTPGVQVSNNKLYSTGVGGAFSGMNYEISLADNENLRARINLKTPTLATSGGYMFGVSSNAIGTIPQGAGLDSYAIYVHESGLAIKEMSLGTMTDITNVERPTIGDYTLTLTVDKKYISCSISRSDGNIIASCRRLRSGFKVNSIYIFNSSNLALSGSYFYNLTIRKSLQTVDSELNMARTIQYTGTDTENFIVTLPKDYDSKIARNLAICWHGNGSNEFTWLHNGNMKAIHKALVDSGYIVLTCSLALSTTTWGNQDSTNAYYKAYRYVLENYAIKNVVFYANSMGGIESLNAIYENKIPCVAWASTVPTYSLKSNYDLNFGSLIKSAYGIASDGSDYSTKTLNRDPALMSANVFRKIPMYMIAPKDDSAVLKADNMDKLYEKVKDTSIEAIAVTLETGGHSFNVAPYVNEIISFLNKYAND